MVSRIEGEEFETDRNGKIVGACAIGMIIIARAGTLDRGDCEETLAEVISELKNIAHYHTTGSRTLSGLVVNRNDENHWPPEEIANELEQLGF